MRKRMSWGLLALVALGAFAWASERNIAPDALTRATQGYNQYEGELNWLSDGIYPDNNAGASAFVWPNKGNLVFEFAAPYKVFGLRLRVGADAICEKPLVLHPEEIDSLQALEQETGLSQRRVWGGWADGGCRYGSVGRCRKRSICGGRLGRPVL